MPLAEVFDALLIPFLADSNDTLDDLATFEPLLPSLTLDVEGLELLFGNTRVAEDQFLSADDLLDVVVDTLDALEPLEELVCLVGVVEVREVFPFNVEALDERVWG